MNTFIIPDGFELTTIFRWEQLPAVLRGVNRNAATPLAMYAALRPAIAPAQGEISLLEEEAERWDGLS